MSFDTYVFFAFFAVVLALHRAPFSWTSKKRNLLLASYLFYAAWNPPFVVLIWFSTIIDWYVARWLAAATEQRSRRRLLLVSLVANLSLLGFFKYTGFLVENFAAALALGGIDWQPAALDIVLPVGISFYTFQTLSYTLDVYLGRARPWISFLDYALYVTFFPQLVAGPIVRGSSFLPQCAEPPGSARPPIGWGLSLLVLGLFEKNVLADALLGPVADRVFSSSATMAVTAGEAWCGALAFSGQIFCDFAGYSTCAIGVALVLGFHLPDNFRCPYGAVGFSDFWSRWHISLSSWLRDYLYIPLGGNRRTPLRTHANLMITMLLGGLWHGASWTYVIWGGLHGLFLVAERALTRLVPAAPIWRAGPVRFALALVTFALVCFSWVFFRAGSLAQASMLSAAMLGLDGGTSPALGLESSLILGTVLVVTAIVVAHWLLRSTSIEEAAARVPWWCRAILLAVLMTAIVLMPSQDRAFIYFQF